MPEEGDDSLDRLFHAVEPRKSRIGPDRPVHKNSAKALVLGRVDHLGLADGSKETLRRGSVSHGVAAAGLKVFRERHLGFAPRLEGARKGIEKKVVGHGFLLTFGLWSTPPVHFVRAPR